RMLLDPFLYFVIKCLRRRLRRAKFEPNIIDDHASERKPRLLRSLDDGERFAMALAFLALSDDGKGLQQFIVGHRTLWNFPDQQAPSASSRSGVALILARHVSS